MERGTGAHSEVERTSQCSASLFPSCIHILWFQFHLQVGKRQGWRGR